MTTTKKTKKTAKKSNRGGVREGAGRPIGPTGDAMEERTALRLSAELKAKIDAARGEQDFSEWVRDACEERLTKIKP